MPLVGRAAPHLICLTVAEENAKLKVIAGLIGVGFEALRQREREAARRRTQIRVALYAAGPRVAPDRSPVRYRCSATNRDGRQ
jgi:hypothetical protein